jgi:hypothetical protein
MGGRPRGVAASLIRVKPQLLDEACDAVSVRGLYPEFLTTTLRISKGKLQGHHPTSHYGVQSC